MSLPSRERGLKSHCFCSKYPRFPVAPFAGAWIEISRKIRNTARSRVAPFAGAWIEILQPVHSNLHHKSLPSRERGLKYGQNRFALNMLQVAPFAGAWIEIVSTTDAVCEHGSVAPFAGAWIEIQIHSKKKEILWVAPFAGAWIEMKKRNY